MTVVSDSFTVDIPVTITSWWPFRCIVVVGPKLSTTTSITSSAVLESTWLPPLIYFTRVKLGVWVFIDVELFCVIWLSPSEEPSQTDVWSCSVWRFF